jgi:hypothetical protein
MVAVAVAGAVVEVAVGGTMVGVATVGEGCGVWVACVVGVGVGIAGAASLTLPLCTICPRASPGPNSTEWTLKYSCSVASAVKKAPKFPARLPWSEASVISEFVTETDSTGFSGSMKMVTTTGPFSPVQGGSGPS